MKNSIDQYYIKSGVCPTEDMPYIKDYCTFIESLCDLKDKVILTKSLESESLFDEKAINALKTIRLHDLYIKLRCSWFALKLKCALEQSGKTTKVVHKYGDIDVGSPAVNINVDMNQGNGQIAAWISNCDSDRSLNNQENKVFKNTFEVVIQGDQYRHGINQSRIRLPELKESEDKFDRLNALYRRLSDPDKKDALAFLDFGGTDKVQPTAPIEDEKSYFKNTKQTKEKDGPFNCYGDSYIYRYMGISTSDTIESLLERMMADIDSVLTNMPKLA